MMDSNATRTTPLISSSDTSSDPLYEPVSMLEIRQDVAEGFLILLSGRDDTTDNDNSLAFLALTDGNVIDTCFGARSPRQASATMETVLAARRAARAKALLKNTAESSQENNNLKELAIETYATAFQIVMDYQRSTSRLNCCIKCCLQRKLHRTAVRDLSQTFHPLLEAVAASAGST